jgi:cell division transport system permease protein
MALLSFVSFVAASALRDLRRTGPAGAAGILLAALAALVVGITLLAADAVDRQATGWRADLRIVAVLTDEAGRPERSRTVARAVGALPGVAAVRYVSPADALADLRRFLQQGSAAADGLDRLATNPVPGRLEVMPSATLDAAGLDRLVTQLRSLPGIETVQAPIGWVAPAERVLRGVRRVGLTLAGALAAVALAAIAAATMLARQRRLTETAVLRLAGAGEGRLWTPLLLQAALQGVAGAGLGVALLWLVAAGGTAWGTAWLRAALDVVPLTWPAWPLAAWLVGGGAGLGLAGGVAGGRP